MLCQCCKKVKLKEPFDSAKCPPAPTPSEYDTKKGAGALATAMGATACQTDNHNFALAFDVGGWGLSSDFTCNYSDAKTLGCEQLLASSTKYLTAIQNISCVLDQSQNVIKTTVNNVNSVNFIAGPYSSLTACGGGVDITQGITMDVITSMNLSQSEIDLIAKEVKSVCDTVNKGIQDNISQAGATASGGKTIIDNLNQFDNIDYNSKVRQALNSVTMTVDANNNINIIAQQGSKVLYSANAKCNFNQNITTKVIASIIVNNVLRSTYSSVIDLINKASNETTQTTKGSGFADQVKAIWDNIVAKTGIWGIILIVLGIVLVIGAIIIGPKLFKTYTEAKTGKKIPENTIQNTQISEP